MTIETSDRRPPTPYAPPKVSWEEYLRWTLANEFPSEWVDGRIVDVLTQNLRSNLIVQFLHEEIRRHIEPRQLDRLIFNFLMRLPNRPSGRVPDLMLISKDHVIHMTDTFLDGPADLAIEVVSVDSLVRDRRDKFLEYEAGGVREYWLVDEHREEARFYVLGADDRYHEAPISDDGVYASTVVPGLRLTVKRIWHEPFASFRKALNGRSPDPTLPTRSASVTIETNGRREARSYSPPLVSWADFHDWALSIEGRAEWVDGEIVELMPENDPL